MTNNITDYKGYRIDYNEATALIYKGSKLIKCVASDYPKHNAINKAKIRIDENNFSIQFGLELIKRNINLKK